MLILFFLLFFFYIFLPKPVLEKDYFHCFSLGCKFQRFSETFVPFLVLISILMLEDAYIFIYSTRLSFSVITLIYSISGQNLEPAHRANPEKVSTCAAQRCEHQGVLSEEEWSHSPLFTTVATFSSLTFLLCFKNLLLAFMFKNCF